MNSLFSLLALSVAMAPDGGAPVVFHDQGSSEITTTGVPGKTSLKTRIRNVTYQQGSVVYRGKTTPSIIRRTHFLEGSVDSEHWDSKLKLELFAPGGLGHPPFLSIERDADRLILHDRFYETSSQWAGDADSEVNLYDLTTQKRILQCNEGYLWIRLNSELSLFIGYQGVGKAGVHGVLRLSTWDGVISEVQLSNPTGRPLGGRAPELRFQLQDPRDRMTDEAGTPYLVHPGAQAIREVSGVGVRLKFNSDDPSRDLVIPIVNGRLASPGDAGTVVIPP